MSHLFLLSLVCMVPVDPLPTRSYRELQNDLREALRSHAQARDDDQRVGAVYDMLRLHCEIVSHPKFATSDALQSYRNQLWSRLMRVQREIERQQQRRQASSSLTSSQPGARGGRAGGPDYGPALVALIERTITPEFWDVNGGPGTIVYYRPLRVLVVRATGDVHGHVGGLLGAVR